MKFWVFSDSRILGPYTREELAGLESVHGGTLVCKEGATGVADGDWLALEAVPELAGLAVAAVPAGVAGSSFAETFDPADPASVSWPPTFQDDPRFNFWMREEYEAGRTVELERTLAEMREQMARHERRQDEILDRLNAKDLQLSERDRELADLRARLAAYEGGAVPPSVSRAPAPAPAARLAPDSKPAPVAKAAPAVAAPALPPLQKAAPPAPQPAPAPRPPALEPPPPSAASMPEPAPVPEPPAPALEEPPLAMESPARAAFKAARGARQGLPASTGPMELSIGAPEPALEAAAPEPAALQPPALEAPALESSLGIPDSESLSPVAEVPPPLDFAPPSPETAAMPPLEAPPPLVVPDAPPPLSPFMDSAFAPQEQPQAPGQISAPQTVLFQGQGGMSLTPSPSPLGPTPAPAPLGATPEPIPLGEQGGMATPMPAMGQPDLPQNVMQGLGVGGQPTPYPFGQTTPLPRLPGQDTGGLEAALTAPPPLVSSPGQPPTVPPTGAATAAKPSPAARFKEALRSKKFVIILGVSFAALTAILMLFLRHPKQLAKTVDMAPEHKTQGSFNVEGPSPRPVGHAPSPFQKRPDDLGGAQRPAGQPPAFPPAAPAQPTGPAPAPAAPPAAPAPRGRDYISDERVEAIEFVKNYKLDEARGTVEAYLQYAFLGPDSVPEWRAGAIDKERWFVEYDLYKGAPGGRGRKPAESYRFEVNLGEKSLVGANPEAKQMLEGTRPAKPKARARPLRRRRAASSQEPLPDERQLDGGAGAAGGGFNNPGG